MPQYPAIIDLSSLDGHNGFALIGEPVDEFSLPTFGASVASAGDVNGDGFDDLIIGDWNLSYSGASYVVFGKAAAFAASVRVSSLDGSNGFKLSGTGLSGASVASAGDVNGDGFADVIVGASWADESHVVFGKASGFAANLDLSSLDGSNGFRLQHGWPAASAGDVNGDGFADLIVGGGDLGEASHVVFGKGSGFAATFDVSSLDGSNGFKISGAASYRVSVASAGDVNGDGFADVVIGAPDTTNHFPGASYVVFGKESGFAANLDVSNLNGSNGFKISGVATSDWSGFSVASAGDVNGDGFADVIIGAPDADPHIPGAAYVVFGKGTGFAADIGLGGLDGNTGFRMSGAAAGDRAGYSVASAGDVNGDGFADVIVGSIGGPAYVVFGKALGFTANIDLSSLDGSNGFTLSGPGYSVASAGDVNGDGFADLIVGYQISSECHVIFGRAPDTAVVRIGTVASQTLAGGAFGDTLSGLGGNDRLYGNGGNDFLEGGLGDDWLNGGAGNDTAFYGLASSAVAATLVGGGDPNGGDSKGGGGFDTLIGIENLVGSAFDDEFTGDAEANRLQGVDGNDTLHGVDGNDRLEGGAGVDTLDGGAGNDTLLGGDDNDRLDGGAGDDRMVGGTGDDIYLVDSAGDLVSEVGGQGMDTVVSLISYTLAGSLENLALTGAGDIDAIGSSLANGLLGNIGNNLLDGKAGADTMKGGRGNDTYVVDTAGDVVSELAGQGTDAVQAAISYTLGHDVETLTLTGTGDIDGTGNGLANTLVGNDGNNVLDGKAGADALQGGAGNDTYIADDVGDVASELAGQGSDTVQASVSYTLAANVENLTLTGAGAINGTGNALANTLVGNGTNNILDGKAGADTMAGGGGNDRYRVDDALDQAIEAAGEGTDQVLASVSYTLGANSAIESLATANAAGTTAINLTGNSLAQAITGNAGANLIRGMAGNDALRGLGGADTFRFSTALGAGNVDHILDYSVADDTVQLENAVFTGLAAGTLAAGAFFTGSAAHDADDRILYNAASGALLFDKDGTGAAAAVQFATISAGLAMINADFVVT